MRIAIVISLGLWMLILSGCTTGGGKFFCGYEEFNEIKASQGYTIPDKKK